MLNNNIDLTERRVFKEDPKKFSYPSNCHKNVPWKNKNTINTISIDYNGNDLILSTSSTFSYIIDTIGDIDYINNEYELSNFTSRTNSSITVTDNLYYTTNYDTLNTTNADITMYYNYDNNNYLRKYIDNYEYRRTEKDVFGHKKHINVDDLTKHKKYIDSCNNYSINKIRRSFSDKILNGYKYTHRINWKKPFRYNRSRFDYVVPLLGKISVDDEFSVNLNKDEVPWIRSRKYKNVKNMGLLLVHNEEEILKELDRLEQEDDVNMPSDSFFVNGVRRSFHNINSAIQTNSWLPYFSYD